MRFFTAIGVGLSAGICVAVTWAILDGMFGLTHSYRDLFWGAASAGTMVFLLFHGTSDAQVNALTAAKE